MSLYTFVENLKGFPTVWSKIVLDFKFMSKNKDFGKIFRKKIVRTAEKIFFWRNMNSVGMRTYWGGKSIKFVRQQKKQSKKSLTMAEIRFFDFLKIFWKIHSFYIFQWLNRHIFGIWQATKK